MRNFLRSRSVVGALLLAASLAGSAALPAVALSQPGPASNRYIVLLRDDFFDPAQTAAEHGKAHGFQASHVYRHALRGYAATLPPGAAEAMRKRPEVLSVSEDGEKRLHLQTISLGVLRVEGDESSTRSGNGRGAVNVNVAVLDDGGPVKHVDLNVVGSTSCVDRPGSTEPFGWHGTVVGGFIGALDNGIGRVGIAPGARLWAVRVLGRFGIGHDSEIICGLDWVTSTRTDADPNNDIGVANMSFGGPLPKGSPNGSCADAPNNALARAICGTIAAGVTIVASAGNDSIDIQNDEPSTYSEVLAVTAMADLDGQPGGLQPPTGDESFQGKCSSALNQVGPVVDDQAAFFSSFATLPEDKAHTIAAPGVCIQSTYPGDIYAIDSGTSFSAPIVSGVVALCIATGHCAGLTPREIIAKIVADAAAYNSMRRNSGYGFVGDPLRPITGKYYGHLISAELY